MMDFVLRNQHRAKALRLACSLIEGKRCRRHLDDLDRLASDAAGLFARIAEGAGCVAARQALEAEGLCERVRLLPLDTREHRTLLAKPAVDRSWAETLSRVEGGQRAPRDLLSLVERDEPGRRVAEHGPLPLALGREVATYRIEAPAPDRRPRLPRASSRAIAALEGLDADGRAAQAELAELMSRDLPETLRAMADEFTELPGIVEAIARARTSLQLVEAFPAAATLFVEGREAPPAAPSILKTL